MGKNKPREMKKIDSMKVAYIMSRFPKIQETFILYEILAVEKQGLRVEVYPLLREYQPFVHPEAEKMSQRAHFCSFISLPALKANWHFLWHHPWKYLKVLVEVLRGTFGSANFFFGAIGIFPKAVRFAYEMAADGIEHVHAHFSNHPAVAALIINRLTGISFSFTAHGHDIHVDRRMLDKKINAAAFAVTISSYNKELMIKECGENCRNKIYIIHCGTDTEVFSPRVDVCHKEYFTIICVCGLWEVKGHRYLVEACRLLKQRGVNFKCHLIGDGTNRKALELQIKEADLKDRVYISGTLTRPGVVEMLSKADVIVQPSVPTRRGSREGIPVSLMEGMACGLPAVASAISGIPELVEEGITGFLTPPRDPIALANALQKLSQDPGLMNRMGQAGRRKVLREFNLHLNAAKLAKLFSAHCNKRNHQEYNDVLRA
jgi:glycosyltransferase involved in cell wall biosynthesis